MIKSMWHILALVLAIGFSFLFYYIVTLIIQLRNTIRTLEKTLEIEVNPVIKNVEGITQNIEQMTGRADNIFGVVESKTTGTINAVSDLKEKSDGLKNGFDSISENLSKYSKAMRVGVKVGINNFKKSNNYDDLVNNNPKVLLSDSKVDIIDHLEKKI